MLSIPFSWHNCGHPVEPGTLGFSNAMPRPLPKGSLQRGKHSQADGTGTRRAEHVKKMGSELGLSTEKQSQDKALL